MLSPNDIKPKGKTPSIWSFDSGYGSNTLEDDEASTANGFISNFNTDQAIGLGIGPWDIHSSNRIHQSRPQIPVQPITTRLRVFPTQTVTASNQPCIRLNDNDSGCIACSLWCITNPGDGSKCNSCREENLIHPSGFHQFEDKSAIKFAVPRLQIPREVNCSNPFQDSKTRCSTCQLAQTTGVSTCSSCDTDPAFLSPTSPDESSSIRRSCARRTGKLPPHAVRHLRAWLNANHHDPYPNSEAKRILAQSCGISEKQVTTWFTNTRARKLALPNDRTYPSSEDEGVYESDLSSAANTPVCINGSTFASPSDCHQVPGGQSFTPYETPQIPPQTSRRGKKKDYRRMNTISPIEESTVLPVPTSSSPNIPTGEQELWQCTFCSQSLVPKSWRRHEETQHLPKHQWICLSTSPRLTIAARTGTFIICAFCSVKNPDEKHFLHSHRIVECARKCEADRTFGRPDHLRQHVKNFHKCSLLDIVRDRWRRDGPGKKRDEGWMCGFCGEALKNWDVRETHIANHFREGKTMASWVDYTLPGGVNAGAGKGNEKESDNVLKKMKKTWSLRKGSRTSQIQEQQHQYTPIEYAEQAQKHQYDIELPFAGTITTTLSATPYTNTSPIPPPTLPQFPESTFTPCISQDFLMNYDFSNSSIPTATTTQDLNNIFTSPVDMYTFSNDPFQLAYGAFGNEAENTDSGIGYQENWGQQQ